MARITTPVDLLNSSLDAMMLAYETQLVMTYRMLGLVGVWSVTDAEKARKVEEQLPAFTEAWWSATHTAMGGGRPDEVVRAWMRPIRRTTKSNAKRLGRRGLA